MSSTKISLNLGTGSLGILLICILAILKLSGYITISWWWVLCPIWVPIALFIGIAAIGVTLYTIVLLIALFIELFDKNK